MNLKEEIMELVNNRGQVKVQNGIVTVVLPNGEIWDFTEPQQKEQK